MLKPQLINALKDEMGYDDNRPQCKDCTHYNYIPLPSSGERSQHECGYNNIGVITDIDPQAVCDKFKSIVLVPAAPAVPAMPHEYDPTVNMRTK